MVSIRGIFFCRIVKFKRVIHGYTFMNLQLQRAPHHLAGILLYTREQRGESHNTSTGILLYTRRQSGYRHSTSTGILLYTREHSISNHVIPKERSDCGNAAIKPRAESSSLELCRGGAGSTEGQSIVTELEIATSGYALLAMTIVKFPHCGYIFIYPRTERRKPQRKLGYTFIYPKTEWVQT